MVPINPKGGDEDQPRCQGMSRAYSRSQFVWAVTLAAVLGWAGVAMPILIWSSVTAPPGSAPLVAYALVASAIFGLPIALGACWTIGAPVLWRLMARPVSWGSAALWGGAVTAAMELACVVIAGLTQLVDRGPKWPDLSFCWQAALGALIVLIGGSIIALIVRAVIGSGTSIDV